MSGEQQDSADRINAQPSADSALVHAPDWGAAGIRRIHSSPQKPARERPWVEPEVRAQMACGIGNVAALDLARFPGSSLAGVHPPFDSTVRPAPSPLQATIVGLTISPMPPLLSVSAIPEVRVSKPSMAPTPANLTDARPSSALVAMNDEASSPTGWQSQAKGKERAIGEKPASRMQRTRREFIRPIGASRDESQGSFQWAPPRRTRCQSCHANHPVCSPPPPPRCFYGQLQQRHCQHGRRAFTPRPPPDSLLHFHTKLHR
jgi:hypothetical protein